MAQPSDPRCSIVIPVYNWASITQQILNRLLATPPAVSSEIIVVDDGSRDQTPSLLAGYGDRIRVVTHASNQGYATACNDGAAIAYGEYLVFLNNDTMPRKGWLDALVRYADAHPRAAIVGSKMLRPDGTAESAGVVMGRLAGSDENVPIPLYYGLPGDHPAVNQSRQFQMVTGACLLIRREVFESVGGLDRSYVNGREDVDLCLMLRERGHEVHYCHESEVVHLGSMTRWSKKDLDDPLADIRSGVALFQSRWADRVPRDDFQYFVEDGLLTVGYGPAYRIQADLSPHLGTLKSGEYERESDRLLERFAVRTFELTRENHRLQARLHAEDLEQLASAAEDDSGITPSWHTWLRNASPARRRELIAALYLEGSGIQLGPTTVPLSLPLWVTVRSVETLDTVPDTSQDFVIASLTDESLAADPASIAEILRVLKDDGIAYLIIPASQFTLDRLSAWQSEQANKLTLDLTFKSLAERIVVLRKRGE